MKITCDLLSFIDGWKPRPKAFNINTQSIYATNVEIVENPDFLLEDKQDQILLGWIEVILSTISKYETSYEVWLALEKLQTSQSKAMIL